MYTTRKDNDTLRLNLRKHLLCSKERQHCFLLFTSVILVLATLAGCGHKLQELEAEGEGQPSVSSPGVSLHEAALLGDIEVIRQHIEAGSDLNEIDEWGNTSLIVAATFGKTEAASALIEAGADLEITNNDGATPLLVAAFFCRTEIVQALLDKGADKSAKNRFGRTALESVAGPFEEVKGVYDAIGEIFVPLGLELDYERIKNTRPIIVEMLK